MATVEITCNECEYSYYLFISMFYTNTPNFLDYLRAHGVLPTGVLCEKCELPCTLRQETNMFYCGRYVAVQKQKRKQCNYSVSLFKGTFLENVRVPPWKIGLFVNHFLQTFWDHETVYRCIHFSSKTSVDWRTYCSEVTHNWMCNQEPIGGPKISVEIDATFFVKRNPRGRQLSDVWLFCGIERESKKKIIIPLHKEGQDPQSAETLLPLIKQYIRIGSIIISDDCTAYKTLSTEGYVHKVFSHNANFEDSGIHKQTIEKQLRKIKKWSKRVGMRSENFDQYFSQYLFIDTFTENPVHQFFLETGKLYRPHGSHPRPPVYDSDEVDSLAH
ncbi:uncharacterized protein [Palaemon carinicauda]|uniref:uncharacterized protein isoform X1 n=1 Tax=Palaemon carinicauda TaxID=392227 RepID=UPI0035B65232